MSDEELEKVKIEIEREILSKLKLILTNDGFEDQGIEYSLEYDGQHISNGSV